MKQKQEPPKTKEISVTRYLKCALVNHEKIDRGRDLAHLYGEKQQLEADMKATRSQYQSRIDGVTGKISMLSDTIRDAAEFRDVQCVQVFDWANKEIYVRRPDTDEIVESRQMRQEELQTEFPIPA